VVSSSVSGSTLIANVALWANKVGLRRFDEAVPIEDIYEGCGMDFPPCLATTPPASNLVFKSS